MSTNAHRPETVALHAGQSPDPTTKARAVPIYQTTSYAVRRHPARRRPVRAEGAGQHLHPDHEPDLGRARAAPGRARGRHRRLRHRVGTGRSDLLGAQRGTRAATTSSRVSTLYGGTYNLFAHTLPQYGIEVRWADPDKPEQVAELTDDKTRLVFAETIGNPKLNVVDIRAWADAAHAQGLPLIVDNTVPTPILCRVFDLGADIVGALRSRSTSAGTAPRSAAWSSTPAASTGRRTPTASPASRSPTRPTTAWSGPTPSARRRTSAACAPCCCATPAPRCRRSTRSCSCRASRRCRCAWSATPRTRSPSRRYLEQHAAGAVGQLPRARVDRLPRRRQAERCAAGSAGS